MRRAALILMLIPVVFIFMARDLNALTFEFNKDRPGVAAFALQYLRFTVDGKNIITRLPATFYVITYTPDDIPVLAAKTGKIDKTSPLSPYLAKISGGSGAKSIKGPHGAKILYHPNRPLNRKLLSAYAVWDGWIFIGNKKETISNLLKLYKNPSDIVKTDKDATSLQEWKKGGVRFWSDNSNNHLYNLFEEQKKRILIPLIKDPGRIQYIAGAIVLTDSKEMSGSIMIKPVNQQAVKDIEGDLRFIGETLRRRLVAIKTDYKGKVYDVDNSLVYTAYIGNYLAAQGQIVIISSPPSP